MLSKFFSLSQELRNWLLATENGHSEQKWYFSMSGFGGWKQGLKQHPGSGWLSLPSNGISSASHKTGGSGSMFKCTCAGPSHLRHSPGILLILSQDWGFFFSPAHLKPWMEVKTRAFGHAGAVFCKGLGNKNNWSISLILKRSSVLFSLFAFTRKLVSFLF